MDFLGDLNDSQRAAVMHTDGPSLIVAGAGSGKTRVLTYRIAYLLQQGVPANHILALTFTNKAAREMKERICRLVSEADARYLWMGTFHAIAARMLRHDADRFGFTHDFSIYDSADSRSLMKQLVKEMQLDEKQYKPAAILARISMAKNALITPTAYMQNTEWIRQDRINRHYALPELYTLYQQRLREANAMDFDDLLTNLCLLLRDDESLRQYYQQIFRYILVDEYQDTNYAQYLIVRLLSQPQNNICVVGDDAQSIYSFRGADIRNILSFQQDYPDARLFKLERNYRSTKTIVAAAGSLINHNEHQIPKHLFSENDEGERLPLVSYLSDREEASGVAQTILRNRNLPFGSYDEVAILYRTNAQSRVFENALREEGIPYRIYGGMSFYQRKEVKDAIAYFRLLANPKDNEALLRIINFPARGIGATTINRIAACAAQNHTSMMDVLRQTQPIPLDVSNGTRKRLNDFLLLINRLTEEADTMDAYRLAEYVMQVSGVMTAAAMDTSTEGRDRKQNLDELLAAIHDFVDRRLQEGISYTPIQDFLAEVSLLTDQDQTEDNIPRVTLMTVHAAKGLEFPTVYVVGLEENLFPSQFCQTAAEIEEERRLLYVAITRAMNHCRLSYAEQRFRNGRVDLSAPSRFLRDIDRQYLQLSRNTFPTAMRTQWEHTTWQTTPRQHQNLKPITPTPATDISHPDLSAGCRVSHRVFGKGTVQRIYKDNDNEKIDILFDQVGNKTLLLAYAKLTQESE